jgi:putative oxygen-independent coproporphyrinogen III oxidase
MLNTAPQKAFHFNAPPPLTLYIHIPWCVRKCPYCDFNSHAARETIPETSYLNALLSDLDHELPRLRGRQVEAVFIGGGTPSLFSPEAIDQLLTSVRTQLMLRPNLEITLEANPGKAERRRFSEFRAVGINRLSIGVQSFDDDCLHRIGRIHGAHEAIGAAEDAHAAGFENFNIDLMFGLPGQDVEASLKDLCTAVSLKPAHISFYQLTIEPNTFFYSRPPILPNDDLIWEMQIGGQGFLASASYTQYEVSAYAQAGRHCEHNLNYWRFGDYLGIGAGAHSKLSCTTMHTICRHWNRRQPRQYMDCARSGRAAEGQRILDADDAQFEFMLNALRLTDGFALRLFAERAGLPELMLEPRLIELVQRELLWRSNGRIGPTSLGRRFLDDVIGVFLTRDERDN